MENDAEVAIKELEEAWGQITATLRVRLIQKANEIKRLMAEVAALKQALEEKGKKDAGDTKG